MTQSDAGTDTVAAIAAVIGEYDRCWAELDFAGIQRLWVTEHPQPVYVGDEYAVPAIGADELGRHWARVAARVRGASMRSRIRLCESIDDDVVRCLLLSEWRLDVRGSNVPSIGNSWITWLLVRRGADYRICHHMEAQVYFSDDSDLGFS